MSGETLSLIILVLLLIGTLPTWPYASSWGYAPSGVLTLVVVIFLIWAIAGERPLFRAHPVRYHATKTSEDLKAAGRDIANDIQSAGQQLENSL